MQYVLSLLFALAGIVGQPPGTTYVSAGGVPVLQVLGGSVGPMVAVPIVSDPGAGSTAPLTSGQPSTVASGKVYDAVLDEWLEVVASKGDKETDEEFARRFRRAVLALRAECMEAANAAGVDYDAARDARRKKDAGGS